MEFNRSASSTLLWDPQGSCVASSNAFVAGEFYTTAANYSPTFYSAYGQLVWTPTVESASSAYLSIASSQPFQYKGQYGCYTDAATGLVCWQNRYYDPNVGRWASRDPSGLDGRVNVYGYVGGDPVDGADASGLQADAYSNWCAAFMQALGLHGTNSDAGQQLASNFDHAAMAAQLPIPCWQLKAYRTIRHLTSRNYTAAVGSLLEVGLDAAAFDVPEEEGAAEAVNASKGTLMDVYESLLNPGVTQYVGITNSFERRVGEWKGTFVIQRIPGLSSLTKLDARSVEQVLIMFHGFKKSGGTLLNQINSISKRNPKYAKALVRGALSF